MIQYGNGMIGFFDNAEQSDPTYDPPHNAPCVVCGARAAWAALAAAAASWAAWAAYKQIASVFFACIDAI